MPVNTAKPMMMRAAAARVSGTLSNPVTGRIGSVVLVVGGTVDVVVVSGVHVDEQSLGSVVVVGSVVLVEEDVVVTGSVVVVDTTKVVEVDVVEVVVVVSTVVVVTCVGSQHRIT